MNTLKHTPGPQAERVSGERNGYYRSHTTMCRPWAVRLPSGDFLRDKAGRLRRYDSASAALRAAEGKP